MRPNTFRYFLRFTSMYCIMMYHAPNLLANACRFDAFSSNLDFNPKQSQWFPPCHNNALLENGECGPENPVGSPAQRKKTSLPLLRTAFLSSPEPLRCLAVNGVKLGKTQHGLQIQMFHTLPVSNETKRVVGPLVFRCKCIVFFSPTFWFAFIVTGPDSTPYFVCILNIYSFMVWCCVVDDDMGCWLQTRLYDSQHDAGARQFCLQPPCVFGTSADIVEE